MKTNVTKSREWIRFKWLKTGSNGFCKHSNESLGSMKGREFPDQTSTTNI
jgi:hypothetical protein